MQTENLWKLLEQIAWCTQRRNASDHDGLNRNGPHRFIYLSDDRLGDVALLEETCHWGWAL
ncbi:hypothetical protein I79_017807 [Cricetulus griseus]|uniref:Uncharacterized protein n=1 Tax=Cricetulus griseus TaxID=10029 RepID=G3I309_CRIGR|nr:hypothetical protein I79_017807 [Cricetulus griseus]